MYVGGPALYFVEVESIEEVTEAVVFANEKALPYFVLAGGSNILVSDAGFSGVVIHMDIKGVKLLEETLEYVEYEVGAGENWDQFVKLCVERGLYGVENMSHVPGTVGASVVQNVGCYGQDVSETIQNIRAVDVETKEEITLSNSDLGFSYRKSKLNDRDAWKGKYIVTHVVFRLNKTGELNMSYGDIQKYFATHTEITPSLQSVRDAVISIRNNKFPFPDSPIHGTCGSFWNADTVDENTYEEIIRKLEARGFQEKAEDLKNKRNIFKVAQGYKVPYGMFVEILGFKKRPHGGAKVLDTHSGVINNFTGTASANDVYTLGQEVVDEVYKEFGIKLKFEPELVGEF